LFIAFATVMAILSSAPAAEAGFGVASLGTAAVNRDGTLDFQAGSHPYEYRVGFELDSNAQNASSLRVAFLRLPPGLTGNPLATPRCSRQDLASEPPQCPGGTQIGIVHLRIAGLSETVSPLYNVSPPLGTLASFGLNLGVGGSVGLQQATLRTGREYGLTESVDSLPSGGVEAISETIWGVPADPSHDAERTCLTPDGGLKEGCASGATPAALLTLPTTCTGPLETTVEAESELEPGVLAEARAFSLDLGGNPASLVACNSLPFDPSIALGSRTSATDSPAALSVTLRLPQEEESEVAEAHLKDVAADLPEGMAVNPSAAAGLSACSPAQVGLETGPGVTPIEFTPGQAECPTASRIGSVRIDTPVLDEPLDGAVYLASEDANPFGSLLAVYLAAYDPVSGVVVKVAGKVVPDPQTGRLRVTFTELPQLPFEDLKLDLGEGPRAVLTTPAVCGAYTTAVELAPWTVPFGRAKRLSPSLRFDGGPGGSPCVSGEAELPNRPAFEARALLPSAGSNSPLVLRLSREDGSQRLSSLDVTLPPGLTAKLRGIPYCPPADVPACPAASEVGTVDVAAGAGPSPLQIGGHVYLAGPYRGAPLSLTVVTPAVAGPFDLGTVVVKVALYVDNTTGQIRAVSDSVPTILRGIPLDIRSVDLDLDRPGFIRNPTSCGPKAITGTATSALGQGASLSVPFQVRNCTGLPFAPELSLRLSGALGRNGHPALRAALRTNPSDAALAGAGFTLPAGELLDLRHLRGLCARGLAPESCPRDSRLGELRIDSPALGAPLQGTVYLRVPSHRLPDLTADLRSGDLRFLVHGRTTDPRGRLGVSLRTLPDIPLTRAVLTLDGGRRGILVNSRSLCRKPGHVGASFSAHNGMRQQLRVPVQVHGCR
jgi:hypothetical protein